MTELEEGFFFFGVCVCWEGITRVFVRMREMKILPPSLQCLHQHWCNGTMTF